MSTGNPLEQIRRRMQSHATPTAFAALAEEHRRAGRFDEAIAVCRDGLSRYPAYVSARVTLGRALLDSGDVAAALAELEQAVAQAPDNLAAARALESAHTALGNAPPPPPLPSLTDLPLRATDPSPVPAGGSVVAEALAAGPDGPQEFGFGPDWSIPDAPMTTPAEDESQGATADPALGDDQDASSWGASAEHSEAPTMVVSPRYLQGEEPAGTWAVPEVIVVDAPEPPEGARVYSWTLDAPADSKPAGEDARAAAVAPTPDPAALWDAPTIEAPLAELFALAPFAEERRPAESAPPVEDGAGAVESSDGPTEPSLAAEPPLAVPEPDSFVVGQGVQAGSTDDGPAVAVSASTADSLDDQSSSFWTGAFGGEPQGQAPAPFSGWAADAAPTDTGADRSPWSEAGPDEQSGPWTVPDGPSATWALGDLHEAAGADATPFSRALDTAADVPAPPALLLAEPDAIPSDDHTIEEVAEVQAAGVPPVPEASLSPIATQDPVDASVASEAIAAPVVTPLPLVDVAWAGSVKSALGEVFAKAGHDESLEPPAHPSPIVRSAMADTAVEAAIEDAVLRDDAAPTALASLQQMLASVRARRAALFHDAPS